MTTQGISVLPCKHFKQQNVSLSMDSTLDSILFTKKKNQNKRREKQEQSVLRTPKYQNLTFPLFFSRLNYKKYVPLFNLPTPANLSFPLFFNKGQFPAPASKSNITKKFISLIRNESVTQYAQHEILVGKGGKVCRITMCPEFKSRGEVFYIKMTIPVLLRLSDVFSSCFPNFLYFTFKMESHIYIWVCKFVTYM